MDDDEKEGLDNGSSDARIIATGFVRRLRDTGWLIEKEGEYEEESKIAINYKVVPIIKSFQEIVSPSIITYNRNLDLQPVYNFCEGNNPRCKPIG